MEADAYAAAVEAAVSTIEERSDIMLATLRAEPYDVAAQAAHEDARRDWASTVLDLKRLSPGWTELTGEVLPE